MVSGEWFPITGPQKYPDTFMVVLGSGSLKSVRFLASPMPISEGLTGFQRDSSALLQFAEKFQGFQRL